MLEKNIEKHLIEGVGALGGMTAKLTVEGRRGWPDRLILLPGGLVIFAELKRPKGGTLSAAQRSIFAKIDALGGAVVRLSTFEQVDKFLWAVATKMPTTSSPSGEPRGSQQRN